MKGDERRLKMPNVVRWAALCLTCWLVVAATLSAQVGSREAQTIEETVTRGLDLLRAGNYAAFLNELMQPDQLKKLARGKPINEVAKTLAARGQFASLERMLSEAVRLKPEILKDGTMAVYHFSMPIDGEKLLGFVRVNKIWYLA